MPFVYSLASSSSGNATYAGTKEAGILIDAGLSLRQLSRVLAFAEIELSAIQAIFVTHEHSDHIKGLCTIVDKLSVPVYASREVLGELVRKDAVPPKATICEINRKLAYAGGVQVGAFSTPHDSAHSLGYKLTFEAGGKTACICTDLGCVTEEVYQNLSGSDFILLESNYDAAMLAGGAYPWFLKERISSNTGHLSNRDCADTLTALFNDGTTKFLLGHLSTQNNRPEVAYAAALSQLVKTGAVLGEDYELSVARKQSIGEIAEV